MPPPGAELTAAGYEYYPQALGQMIRLAARKTRKPIFVTESGIGTDDDTRRIAWLDACVAEVEQCLAEGIDVKSYIYWSLLDNFEWTQGYAQRSAWWPSTDIPSCARPSRARNTSRISSPRGLWGNGAAIRPPSRSRGRARQRMIAPGRS